MTATEPREQENPIRVNIFNGFCTSSMANTCLLNAATFVLPTRRHPAFDDRFFGPRSINLRHIAAKTNTHLEMPENMNEPVR